MEYMVGIVALVCIFVVLPYIVLNAVTQWKKNRSLSVEDENLMDELYDLARRLSERVETVERLVAADNPSFRPGTVRQSESYAALADERRIERENDLLGRREPTREARSRFDRN